MRSRKDKKTARFNHAANATATLCPGSRRGFFVGRGVFHECSGACATRSIESVAILTVWRSALSAAAINRSIASSSNRQLLTVANCVANRFAASRNVIGLVPSASAIRRASLRS